jgi:hypothetical protein
MVPKSKIKVNVLNLSDKVKILDLLKGSTALAKVGWHCGVINQAPVVHY